MADFTGQSTVGSLSMSTPGMKTREYEIDTDPFKVQPEIMYRAYHQQRQLEKRQPPTVIPHEPVNVRGKSTAASSASTPKYKNLMGGLGRDSEIPYEVQLQLKALQEEDARRRQPQQEAFFVKPSFGFNMGGGMRPAQAWESGAVAGGFMPVGTRAPSPGQAQIIDSPFPSRASLTREPPKPPQFDPSAYGMNPWATR